MRTTPPLHRVRTAGALAALTAVTVVGAACSDDAAALTRDEWVGRANAVCAAGAARAEVDYEALDAELRQQDRTDPTAVQLEVLYDRLLSNVDQQVAEIGALDAPASIRVDVDAFLDAAQEGLTAGEDLDADVVFDGDRDPFEDATARARALGLTECGDEADEADDQNAAPAEPSVDFAYPADGAQVTSPVALTMAAEGFTVEPAGPVRPGAGHLHVMVDVPCVDPGETIPSDDAHRHYGDGQTGVQVDLAPGEHTLCLQAADGSHTATDLTDTLTVEVVGGPERG